MKALSAKFNPVRLWRLPSVVGIEPPMVCSGPSRILLGKTKTLTTRKLKHGTTSYNRVSRCSRPISSGRDPLSLLTCRCLYTRTVSLTQNAKPRRVHLREKNQVAKLGRHLTGQLVIPKIPTHETFNVFIQCAPHSHTYNRVSLRRLPISVGTGPLSKFSNSRLSYNINQAPTTNISSPTNRQLTSFSTLEAAQYATESRSSIHFPLNLYTHTPATTVTQSNFDL